MRYRAILPTFVLGAALTVTGCGTDDGVNEYDTAPPATETTTPIGTDPAPGAYDPAMTTDTAAWGADTTDLGTGLNDTTGLGVDNNNP